MKNRILNTVVAVSLIGIATACNTVKNSSDFPFTLQDAFYYSWVAGEDEKGTDIFIELNKLSATIDFDSLIFRGVRLPVFTDQQGDRIVLKAILPAGISRIKIEPVPDPRPNQLIYMVDGQKHSFLLEEIRREKLKQY